MKHREYDYEMLRPDIEYAVLSGLEHHRDYGDGNAEIREPTPEEPVTLVDSAVTGVGEDHGTPLKVVYYPEEVVIQVHIHDIALPMSRREIDDLLENGEDRIALSDMAHEKYEIYEEIVIDTVATELGKYYDGENAQAVKNRDEATLIYPSELDHSAVEPHDDPHVIPFTCRLDPAEFWELP